MGGTGDGNVSSTTSEAQRPKDVPDYATPVAHARHLHEAIQGSTLTIIPGARHLTPVECPDQIAALLR